MREIKFRGIDANTNQWIYGNLVDSGLVKKKQFYILKEDVDNYDEIEMVFMDSVGQFTGLKDKNGVDIYECDIINSNYFKKGLVVFWRYGWHFNTGKDCHHSFNTSSHSFEIIGNVYENPELLAVPTAVL